MITSIQLHNEVKAALDKLKEKHADTYEDVIVKMISQLEKQKRKQRELLIEGYKEMAEDNLKITKEFEAIEKDFDWIW